MAQWQNLLLLSVSHKKRSKLQKQKYFPIELLKKQKKNLSKESV